MILRRDGSAWTRNRVIRRHSRGIHGAVALLAVLAAGAWCVVATPAAIAATGTTVSLTFDNNTLSQYTLGFQQALQPAAWPPLRRQNT